MDGTEELRRLNGETGADVLSDALDGGAGDHRLTAGPVADDLVAGDGNDARNGVEDSVDCGPGDDTAIVDDREDGVLDCESVQSP